MDDDCIAWLLSLPDHALAEVVWLLTGVPATQAELRAVRSACRRLLHRRRRIENDEADPEADHPVVADPTREFLIELLSSPEFLVALDLMMVAQSIAAALAADMVERLRTRALLKRAGAGVARTDLDVAHAYAVAKASPDGLQQCDVAAVRGADPYVRIVFNSGTAEHLEKWRAKLARAREARGSAGVLDAIEREGARISAVHPDLSLSGVMPGPPLGLWPPPPPAGPGTPGSAPGAVPRHKPRDTRE